VEIISVIFIENFLTTHSILEESSPALPQPIAARLLHNLRRIVAGAPQVINFSVSFSSSLQKYRGI
jgi:hypothetical protein